MEDAVLTETTIRLKGLPSKMLRTKEGNGVRVEITHHAGLLLFQDGAASADRSGALRGRSQPVRAWSGRYTGIGSSGANMKVAGPVARSASTPAFALANSGSMHRSIR